MISLLSVIEKLSPSESIVLAIFLFATVIVVLAVLCGFFKLFSLVFTKTDVIKETCNKCVVRTKAAFAKFIASLKKDK